MFGGKVVDILFIGCAKLRPAFGEAKAEKKENDKNTQ